MSVKVSTLLGSEIKVYHGSDKIIERPLYGTGISTNDYGLGFYMSPFCELAAEWAVPNENIDGYVNEYVLNISQLRLLDIDMELFECWVSILVQNRGGSFSDVVKMRIEKFINLYPFSVKNYDVVKGWRADDAYFGFVRDFFNAALSLENLKIAMKFGDLGTQYCLISQKAFDTIKFVSQAKKVLTKDYNPLRKARDDSARNAYKSLLNKGRGTLILDIVGRD